MGFDETVEAGGHNVGRLVFCLEFGVSNKHYDGYHLLMWQDRRTSNSALVGPFAERMLVPLHMCHALRTCLARVYARRPVCGVDCMYHDGWPHVGCFDSRRL